MMTFPIPAMVVFRELYQDKQTPGKLLYIPGGEREVKSWFSLEAAWSNNIGGCYPEGLYVVKREKSDKFGIDLWELVNVPDREECKFHWGNYFRNYDGCTGIGYTRGDLNKDGYMDITGTKDAIIELNAVTQPYKLLPLIVTGPHNGWTLPNYIPQFAQVFG